MAATKNMKRKPKACTACHIMYQPKGNSSKFCLDCSEFRATAMVKYHSTTRRVKAGRNVGVGSGGANAHTAENVTIGTYRRVFLTRLYLLQRGTCYDCKDPFPESVLLVHHKDHNRHNNVMGNLQLVCKRCHQIEHECWLAFSKV